MTARVARELLHVTKALYTLSLQTARTSSLLYGPFERHVTLSDIDCHL